MEQKEQQMRISDEEISVLKTTFAENDALLKSVRKAMLGLPMKTDEAKYLAELFKSEELKRVVRKMFLPEIDGDAPLGQILDLWMTVSIVDKMPDIALMQLESRELLIQQLEAGLQNLEKGEEINLTSFTVMKDEETDYINIITRNTLINHVDQQLIQIKILAGRKEESVEDTKKRLQKDSTQ